MFSTAHAQSGFDATLCLFLHEATKHSYCTGMIYFSKCLAYYWPQTSVFLDEATEQHEAIVIGDRHQSVNRFDRWRCLDQAHEMGHGFAPSHLAKGHGSLVRYIGMQIVEQFDQARHGLRQKPRTVTRECPHYRFRVAK
jgi:hypothetical protein